MKRREFITLRGVAAAVAARGVAMARGGDRGASCGGPEPVALSV